MENDDLTPHFEDLPDGALRRYQEYFSLRGENGSYIKSREELIDTIKKHFDELEIDEKNVTSIVSKQVIFKDDNVIRGIKIPNALRWIQ